MRQWITTSAIGGIGITLLSMVMLTNANAEMSAVKSAETKVDFNRDVRPILAKNCFACHGPDAEHREAGLRLDQRDQALAELKSSAHAIVPGQPGNSELVARITETDDSLKMPPAGSGRTLKPAEIETLKLWITQGAGYAEHWSFVAPKRPAPPVVTDKHWARNDLDLFILARLEAAGLKPAPEADRYALVRRVSLDLRGLPASPAEIEQFVNDKDAKAYENMVDRMLADPAYGERWARMWLDQARYADSMGYGSDPLRTIWRYRDWVIDAFNHNQPFDQFTIDQIAGDLLPNPTLEQRMATAFHRNTMTNTEGGTDDEEFRVAAIKDRVDTTMQVWMGLTMGCAKCHNHKFDPITQKEYYQFYGFFNQTADADLGDEGPRLEAPSAEQVAQIQEINAKIAALKQQLDSPAPPVAAALVTEQAAWEAGLAIQAPWTVLKPVEATALNGSALSLEPDGAVLPGGTAPEQETYTVTYAGLSQADAKGWTALRLDVLPDPTLPGVGRSAPGNFVLSRATVSTRPVQANSPSVAARFVRVEVPGADKLLSLAEVQVFAAAENLAVKGKASQSSTDYDGPPRLAIDGNTNGHYFEAKSTTHTGTENTPWWEVDLGAVSNLDRIVLWNRTDGGTAARLVNFRVLLLNGEHQPVWQQDVADYPNPSREFALTGVMPIALSQAVADFAQEGFPASAALAGDVAKNGWAVGPQSKQPHHITFVPKTPIDARDRLLTVQLDQKFSQPQHLLGRFRVSATTDAGVQRRLAVPTEMLAIVDTAAALRTGEQLAKLAAYYKSIAPALQATRDEIAKLEKSRPAAATLPVMVELAADKHRKTFIMMKGNFLSPGTEVTAATPAAFHALPPDTPMNRLGVARWLLDPSNPLTSRVAANRFWSQLFGSGLVETEEDFGTQGELPSHPELLDWLAVEFRSPMAKGDGSAAVPWDMKAFLRTIVTSASYRQSAKVSPQALAKDPRNRLLSRSPRYRLEAEMVRDQALALSGLLSHKMHGPSVYPPQPPGLWQAAFNGQRTWATSEGEDKYRRGLYTFWRRTIPYPSMATFDAPSREICSIRRIRTNTPLQAFVTLNDPVYVEAAQALARRIVKEGGATPEAQAKFALQLCLGRPANPAQINQLVALWTSENSHFRADLPAATALATEPLGPIPAGIAPADLAAWTVVANVLLNLDGVLTRG